MLYNPESATYAEFWLNPFKAAGAALAVETISAPVRNESELDSVIAAQAREPNSGLVVMPDSFLIAHRLGNHIARGPLSSPRYLSLPLIR